MSLLEHVLESYAIYQARNLGWIPLKLNNAASDGWPDRQFIKDEGDLFFVEFKREGEKLRKLQEYRCKKLACKGHRVYVVDNKEEWHRVYNYERDGCVGTTPVSRMGC